MGHEPVAIVSGAGSGIGRRTAEVLARRGWRLALGGRRVGPLRETGELLGGAEGRRWIACETDIADPTACETLVHRTREAFGAIDGLVNNAGYAPLAMMGEISSEQIERIFRVNAIGPTQLVRAAWATLARSDSPRVVNVSSVAARDPFPGLGVYGGAKAALNLLAHAWTREGEAIGLRAFSVAPGAVETGMLRSIVSASDLPSEQCLSPDDVAEVIVACLMGERDAIAGRTIYLPGPGLGERVWDPSA